MKALSPVCQFRAFRLLAQNMEAHLPEEALSFMFSALVSFNAPRKPCTSISFVVMLLTEAFVKESDGIRKDQIYPLRTAIHDAFRSLLFQF